MCFVSQLERCSHISPHKLIVSCSIFEKIDSYRVSSVGIVLDEDPEGRQDQFEAMNQHLWWGQSDHEDRVSFMTPLSSYLTSWISRRDSCLVGVSCHSPSSAPVVLAWSCCIMFKFYWTLNWGKWKPQKSFTKMINIKNCSKWAQQNVPANLWKYWQEL